MRLDDARLADGDDAPAAPRGIERGARELVAPRLGVRGVVVMQDTAAGPQKREGLRQEHARVGEVAHEHAVRDALQRELAVVAEPWLDDVADAVEPDVLEEIPERYRVLLDRVH